MSNPFETLADRQMVRATKDKHRRREAKLAKSDADAPMKLSAMEQEQADQSTQFRMYKRAKKEEERLVAEKYKSDWAALFSVIDGLKIDEGETMVDYITGANWLHEANIYTRQIILGAIERKLIVLRIMNGYAPFNDSLPGEQPKLFEIIREKLKVMTP